jgi:hypothetical protein
MSALEDGVSCGTDFCGEDLEDFEGHEGIVLHEGVEVFAGDEAETRAGVGDGCEGVGLVADQGGKAEQRAGDGANGDDRLSGLRSHGKGDFAADEDVKADCGISL